MDPTIISRKFGKKYDWKRRSHREQNLYRARHGASPLTYDYGYLEKKAQNYAEYLSNNEIFMHDPSNSANRIGENLAMSSKSQISIMTRSWYEEIQKYNFQKCDAQSGCGHFTQMIWKSTTKVGCGVSESRSGIVYMVCKYSPAGNVIGLFAKNVNPPRK
uniref:CAP domain-containing protein (inferred by orthology to a human protein) n=1 Tax=Strongyloides venezuelensis TaxID=75913 RepID=A0A0K0FCA4_STRVS